MAQAAQGLSAEILATERGGRADAREGMTSRRIRLIPCGGTHARCPTRWDMEAELVVRAQQGDEGAFADLTFEIGARLYRIAYGILRDPHRAEDAAQAALLEIWRHLPGLREPSRFEAWAWRTLVRACYREARRTPRMVELTWAHDPVAGDDVSVIDDRDQLERAFRRLSIDQRAVVVLHHYQGLTLDEVAASLGIPVGTANSRLGRAMATLRTAMADDPRASRPAVREAIP
jgi:RNA polymerase sigma factor (sigma-70 family)